MTASGLHLGSDAARWMIAMLAAVAMHAAVAWRLWPSEREVDSGASPGAFVVEIAEIPVARRDAPTDLPPGLDQVEAAVAPESSEPPPDETKELLEQPHEHQPPVELPKLPPLREADAELPPPPTSPKVPPPPQPALQPQNAAPVTSASSVASEQKADRAVAPRVAPPSKVVSSALPTWQSALATALERSKRYPSRAHARREEGTVHVVFSIDHHGRLLAYRVAQSSGHELLDHEALALLERAQPFPPPPPELSGGAVSLTVPIRFNLQ